MKGPELLELHHFAFLIWKRSNKVMFMMKGLQIGQYTHLALAGCRKNAEYVLP